jgi:hypothetical protein
MRRRRARRLPFPRDAAPGTRRVASRRPTPPSLPTAAFGRLPRDPPAQVTRGSYGGAGPSRQKNCRFARKSGTPGSGGQEGGQGARAPSSGAFPRERAHPPLTAERQPAPKSAPVSQDSKHRGGSPTERHRICTRARTFPRESQRSSSRRRVIDKDVASATIAARRCDRNWENAPGNCSRTPNTRRCLAIAALGALQWRDLSLSRYQSRHLIDYWKTISTETRRLIRSVSSCHESCEGS